MTEKRPTIVAIGTGGTISRVVDDRLDVHEYMLRPNPRLRIPDLIARYPEIGATFRVEAHDLDRTPGLDSGDSDWLSTLQLLGDMAAKHPDLAGAIVTSGTSRLEELAYFLHLTHKLPVPVVVVGSMRPNGVLASDVGSNLYGACRVAASDHARDIGVLTVMNGEIHCARDVTKATTMAVGALQSRDFGPLGFVDPNSQGPMLYRRPIRIYAPHTEFDVAGLEQLPPVSISFTYAGSDGTAIRGMSDSGSAAIVNAGGGAGMPTAAEVSALEDARDAGAVIVIASRTGQGVVPQTQQWRELGFVSADNLTPQKARILTALALTQSSAVGDIQRCFDRY